MFHCYVGLLEAISTKPCYVPTLGTIATRPKDRKTERSFPFREGGPRTKFSCWLTNHINYRHPLVNSHNYGKSPCLMGKSRTFGRAMFNSYAFTKGYIYHKPSYSCESRREGPTLYQWQIQTEWRYLLPAVFLRSMQSWIVSGCIPQNMVWKMVHISSSLRFWNSDYELVSYS